MCQYLLSVGADPSIVNDQGHSALGAAAISDKVDVVRLLLKHLPDDVDVNKHLNPISRDILLDRNSESGQLLIQLGLQIKGDV